MSSISDHYQSSEEIPIKTSLFEAYRWVLVGALFGHFLHKLGCLL
jgi:hypothetical protein